MKLTVVGCSGSMPGPDSPASCYVVESDGTTLVLDMGSGAIGPLQRVADLGTIDAVLVSHLHPDHCLDLCAYYVALQYGPWHARGPVPVWGPAGTADRLSRAYAVDGNRDMSAALDVRHYPAGPFRVGEIQVAAVRVPHRGDQDPEWMEAFAIRVEAEGRSFVYSGDTGRCDSLTELARGADVLLCEASSAEHKPYPAGLHLSGREAGECAAEAGVGRLVLTHIPPWSDAEATRTVAARVFDGEVTVASPGLTL